MIDRIYDILISIILLASLSFFVINLVITLFCYLLFWQLFKNEQVILNSYKLIPYEILMKDESI